MEDRVSRHEKHPLQVTIGTQQLDFLSNRWCRLNFLQYLSIIVDCRYLDIVTLFRGSLKHKRGVLGYRIALSAFDNDYIPSGEHSFVQYRSLRKDAHMRGMWTDTCGILRSH